MCRFRKNEYRKFYQLQPFVHLKGAEDWQQVVAHTVSYHFYQKEEVIIFEVVPLFSKKGEVKQPFLRNKAVTVFQVFNLKKHNINQSNLPDNAGVTILSMAITHARALLAKSAAGTKFKSFLIPIVNPSEIYHALKDQSLKETV